MEEGRRLYRAGDAEAALRTFNQAAAADPSYVGAKVWAATALIRLERWQEAAQVSRAALAETQDAEQMGALHHNLCRAFEGMDRTEDAIRECEESLRVRPGNNLVATRLERLRRDGAADTTSTGTTPTRGSPRPYGTRIDDLDTPPPGSSGTSGNDQPTTGTTQRPYGTRLE